MSEESPLYAQGGETPQEEKQATAEPRSKFGGLRVNPKARAKRDKRKFFDSADWAMKAQQGEDGEQSFGLFTPPTNEETAGPCLFVAEENASPLAG